MMCNKELNDYVIKMNDQLTNRLNSQLELINDLNEKMKKLENHCDFMNKRDKSGIEKK